MIRELAEQIALHGVLLAMLPTIVLLVLARQRIYPHRSLLAVFLLP